MGMVETQCSVALGMEVALRKPLRNTTYNEKNAVRIALLKVIGKKEASKLNHRRKGRVRYCRAGRFGFALFVEAHKRIWLGYSIRRLSKIR